MLQQRKGYGVPADAIMARGQGREVIFVFDNGKAKLVEVRRGIVESVYAEILDGEKLKSASVIVSGHTFVNNGDKVIANPMEK